MLNVGREDMMTAMLASRLVHIMCKAMPELLNNFRKRTISKAIMTNDKQNMAATPIFCPVWMWSLKIITSGRAMTDL